MAKGTTYLPQRHSASCPSKPLLPPVLLDQLFRSAAHDKWDIQVCDGWDGLLVCLRLRHVSGSSTVLHPTVLTRKVAIFSLKPAFSVRLLCVTNASCSHPGLFYVE